MAPRVHRYLTFPETDSGVCVSENDDSIESIAWRDDAGVCSLAEGCFATRAAINSVAIAVAFTVRISAAAVRRAGRARRNTRRQDRFITERNRAIQSRFNAEARHCARRLENFWRGSSLRNRRLDRRPVR